MWRERLKGGMEEGIRAGKEEWEEGKDAEGRREEEEDTWEGKERVKGKDGREERQYREKG